MKNPLFGRISIEMEGNIESKEFEDFFEKLEKKLDILIPEYTWRYLKDCYTINIGKYDLLGNYDSLYESNILELDSSIKQSNFFVPTELLIQKYNLFDKTTFKTIKKACRIYDNFQTKIDPYEAIHVNLDARTFFPYLKEIYFENFELYDLNHNYRKPYPLEREIVYDGKKIIFEFKRSSIWIDFGGRIELRIFNSDCDGRKKLIDFLKSTKRITKEGYKEFDLRCFDELDNIILSKIIDSPRMTNYLGTQDERFKNFKEFKEKHKKGESFIVNEFFSLKYEEYDKIL